MARKQKRITDQFRELYRTSGKSQAEIAKATRIDIATLSRFASGERFLSPSSFDVLAEYLGWEAKKRQK